MQKKKIWKQVFYVTIFCSRNKKRDSKSMRDTYRSQYINETTHTLVQQ
jgi:hypothetical protein